MAAATQPTVAAAASEFICIEAAMRRFVVQRENDPVWSDFLSKASISEKDKEYRVSEEVSRVIHNQLRAYSDFMNYLDGVAYVEFKCSSMAIPRARGRERMILTADQFIVGDGVAKTISDRVIVTRRQALKTEAIAARDTLILGIVESGPVDVVMDGRVERVKCVITRDADVTHNIRLIAYSDVKDLVYLDDIDEISQILNMPKGWQYWVPTRNISSSGPGEEHDRRKRIAHTIEAGRVQLEREIPFFLPEYVGEPSETDIGKLPYCALSNTNLHGAIDEAVALKMLDQCMYTYGAIHLASLSAYMPHSSPGLYDIDGIVWSDVILAWDIIKGCYDMTKEGICGRDGHPSVLRTTLLYKTALLLVSADVGGNLDESFTYVSKPAIIRARRIISERLAGCLPKTTNPLDIGLSKIITGSYADVTDNALQRMVDSLIAKYHGDKRGSRYDIVAAPPVGRTLGQYLFDETSSRIAETLYKSLTEWYFAHRNGDHPRLAATIKLAEELDNAICKHADTSRWRSTTGR